MLYSDIIKKHKHMMQDFLVEWINWYYGDGQYPNELQDKMTFGQKLEAIEKTDEIKRIVGRSR
jgi:hypothetical protein